MQQFTTNQETLSALIGNGKKFKVPKFQRDYSWEEEQWEELWDDISDINFSNKDDGHYMGYIVLQKKSDVDFIVVDGQQRLTTLSIMIIAALYRLNELIDSSIDVENNIKRKLVLQNYIGFTNPITLATDSKLTLNRNNSKYYRFLCQLNTLLPLANIKFTEKLLRNVKIFFENKLINKFGDNGQAIIEFITNVSYRMYFTTIIVSDDVNAYKIFETLNARGVQLSTPDLLKNYLFSLIASQNDHDSVLDELDGVWEDITAKLGVNSFSDFVRIEWNSRNPTATKNELFKKLSSSIKTASDSYDYLSLLNNRVYVYSALLDYNNDLWLDAKASSEIRSCLKLFQVFKVVQPIVVLLASYINFDIEDFVKVLRYLEIITIRYNIICGRNARDQEALYNKIARAINDKKCINAADVRQMLFEIYPDDSEFVAAFEKKEFKNKRTQPIKYLLLKLEMSLNHSLAGSLDSDLTLEHVLPENPDENWMNIFGNDFANSVYMVGNLALLSVKQNNNIDRKLFNDKKEVLFKSGLETNKMFESVIEWNRDAIIKRQKELAKYAKTLWRINF